jgi:carboxypeptidase PM20D1
MPEHPADGAVERLARALTFRTISAYPTPPHPEEFTGFLNFLEDSYPRLFARATVLREDPWRLVVEVPGSNPGLDPALLLAHYDVVGIEPGTEHEWEQSPFSGAVDAEYVWGRGSLDDKSPLMAMLEAAESMCAVSDLPRRGLVLAFGGDEELSGGRGARTTAREFLERHMRFYCVLDEGSAITDGVIENVRNRIAMIGVSQKGHAAIRVRAHGAGGHAGRPPANTALGLLAKAITRMEANQFPVRRIGSIESFFRTVGPAASGASRFVFRHPRLMWPILARRLTANPRTNALVRTTQAVTMASGSTAVNVLPQSASCTIDVRILPGDSVASVLRHYRKLLAGLDVEVESVGGEHTHEPAPETSTDHPAFSAIARAVESLESGVLVAPFTITDSTDSRHFARMSDAVLRFAPLTVTPGELSTIHGTNERLAIRSYGEMIQFYNSLIRTVCLEG